MPEYRFRRGLLAAPLIVALAASAVFADQYDPPANYYSTATGTGSTLKSQLFTITSTNFIARTYGDDRYALGTLDRDPNNSANILLVYNRASVSGTWDSGVTFNREHVWPKSLLGLTSSQVTNSYFGVASDLFELRPSNPNINSARLNYGYGNVNAPKPAAGYGIVQSNGTFWYPGDADVGDVARTIFYMATRYGQGQTHNISLVNGAPGTYQMGDLNSLLHWNYEDTVDDFERHRNQAVFSSALNPSYYQNNRNPFIDHPEYVWSIFGTGANNSELSVGAPAADGSSTTNVDLGRVISGSSFSAQPLLLSKSGSTPTTFDTTATGDASSSITGLRNAFDYNPTSRAFSVGIAGSTASTGLRTGQLQFHNTDLTSAAAGEGAADGDDFVNVHGAVVSHAQPSLASDSSLTSTTVDFGIVARGSAAASKALQVANLGAAGSYVAGLDVDSVTTTGDTTAFTNTLPSVSGIAVGTSQTFTVIPATDSLGAKSSTLSIATSDEDIPGATSLATLSVNFVVRVAIGGDATLNDHVDFDDLVVVAQNYGLSGTIWQTGDFDGTGTTDFDDLVTLAQNYELTPGDSAAIASAESPSFVSDWKLAQSLAPEPASIAILVAMVPFASRRRR